MININTFIGGNEINRGYECESYDELPWDLYKAQEWHKERSSRYSGLLMVCKVALMLNRINNQFRQLKGEHKLKLKLQPEGWVIQGIKALQGITHSSNFKRSINLILSINKSFTISHTITTPQQHCYLSHQVYLSPLQLQHHQKHLTNLDH